MMCIIKQGRKLELGSILEICTYSTTLKEGGREGILQQDQGSTKIVSVRHTLHNCIYVTAFV